MKRLHTATVLLIESFDSDFGQSEKTYEAAIKHIDNDYGHKVAAIFDNAVNSTDGAFYIREGMADIIVEAMEKELNRE